MRGRRLALLIVFYVSLDFASPFVAGAFTFNADESVDGVHAHRQQVKVVAAAAPMPVAERAEYQRTASLTPPGHEARPLSKWLVALRRAHAPTAATASISEDH